MRRFKEEKHAAFTLAEVLITLGIIGVVAALTLPTLIQNHTKSVVETRLATFYSKINQALQMAEANYGDKTSWYNQTNSVDTDEEGNPINGSSTVEKWWNTYIAPYMKTTDITYDEKGLPFFHLADGTTVYFKSTTDMRDWIFFPGNTDKCLSRYDNNIYSTYGKCSFTFLYMPLKPIDRVQDWIYHTGKGIEPYKYIWDGKTESLINGSSITSGMTAQPKCNDDNGLYSGMYCTALIQQNGWKIPKDYPFKVSY